VSGTARPPAPVIAPVSGAPEQRLQQIASSITDSHNQIAALQTQIGWGVTDGSDAQPGQIGEYIFANRTTAQLLGISSGVSTDLATITLSAGDWDVLGAVYFQGSSSSGADDLRAWVHTVSATQPSGDTGGLAIISTSSGGLVNMLPVPPIRALGSATSTLVYLGCNATFGSGTMQAKGWVRARRMR